MRRRKLDALRRHQAGVGIVRLRQVRMHMLQDLVARVRTGNRQNQRMHLANHIFFHTQATGNDDLAVCGERLADGIERFFNGSVDEATGIDHHQIGAFI